MNAVIPFPVDAHSSLQTEAANPLLVDLELPRTRAEIVAAISKDPFRDPEWRRSHADPDLLMEYLEPVVIPTETAIRIASAVYGAIRRGYFLRDPADPSARRIFMAKGAVAGLRKRKIDAQLLLGETGLGKSHDLKAALGAIPQRLQRGAIEGFGLAQVDQVVFLYVDMTSVASMEALLDRIVEAVDEALGAKGETIKAIRKGRGSVEAYAGSVLRFLKTHLLGILIIDEIQANNLGLDRRDGARLRNFLIGLSNAGIPVLFSGNPLAVRFEQRDKKTSSQLLRRLLGKEPIRVGFAEGPQNADFVTILRGLSRCSLLSAPVDLLALAKEFYRHTAAINDFIVELWVELQRLVIPAGGDATITPELVAKAAQRCPKISKFKPLIEGIVYKDARRLKAYDDVDADYYKELWEAERSHPNVDGRGANSSETLNYNVADGKTIKEVAEFLLRQLSADRTRANKKNAQDDGLMDQLTDSLLTGLKEVVESK